MKSMVIADDGKGRRGLRAREGSDRRRVTWRTFVCSVWCARRKAPRRRDETRAPYYTDQYDGKLVLQFSSILLLCVADAGLTLQILAQGGNELNPLMDLLLEIDAGAFFVGKYGLTSVGLLLIMLHANFKVLNLCSVRHVVSALCGFYVCLVAYELIVLTVV